LIENTLPANVLILMVNHPDGGGERTSGMILNWIPATASFPITYASTEKPDPTGAATNWETLPSALAMPSSQH
jgi:hypothetical protein